MSIRFLDFSLSAVICSVPSKIVDMRSMIASFSETKSYHVFLTPKREDGKEAARGANRCQPSASLTPRQGAICKDWLRGQR
jgi:hypothetical protein